MEIDQTLPIATLNTNDAVADFHVSLTRCYAVEDCLVMAQVCEGFAQRFQDLTNQAMRKADALSQGEN